MANVLKPEKQEQIRALGQLGWSLRRIQEATGVRRETISRHLRASGVPLRPPRGRRPPAEAKAASQAISDPQAASNPASQPIADLERGPGSGWGPVASACEPYQEWIGGQVELGRTAKTIWQDLVDDHGFEAGYLSVQRFVRRLRGARVREAHPTIVTGPGEEGQVDYGTGPMVRHPKTGRYRRTRRYDRMLCTGLT